MLNTIQQINSSYVKKSRLFRWSAVISIVVGIGILAWSIIYLISGYQAGQLPGSISYTLSIGAAVLLFGSLLIVANFRLAGLFLVASLGQVSALQLIDAGKNMHYQHYILQGAYQEKTIAVLLIAIQTIIVGIAAWQSRASIFTGLRLLFKPWQLVLFVGVVSIFSATVSPDVKIFIQELLFAAILQLVNLVNIVLIAVALPAGLILRLKKAITRIFGQSAGTAGASPPQIDRFVIGIAVWTMLLSAFFSQFSYQRHPHIPDEVCLYLPRPLSRQR